MENLGISQEETVLPLPETGLIAFGEQVVLVGSVAALTNPVSKGAMLVVTGQVVAVVATTGTAVPAHPVIFGLVGKW
jgi:hypothetical protein